MVDCLTRRSDASTFLSPLPPFAKRSNLACRDHCFRDPLTPSAALAKAVATMRWAKLGFWPSRITFSGKDRISFAFSFTCVEEVAGSTSMVTTFCAVFWSTPMMWSSSVSCRKGSRAMPFFGFPPWRTSPGVPTIIFRILGSKTRLGNGAFAATGREAHHLWPIVSAPVTASLRVKGTVAAVMSSLQSFAATCLLRARFIVKS